MDDQITILCVDDEQNVLNALKRLFLDEDYRILTATSGEEGLEILEKEQAQIVISDYRMPGTNGVEFLRKVCARWPETIRIVLSGYADISAIVEAVNEGQIYKFIPKPWNDDELKVTVSNAIERYCLAINNKVLTAELQEKNEKLAQLNDTLRKLLDDNSASLTFRSYALNSYQNILNSIPLGIAGVDPDEQLVMCNLAWVNIMGGAWHVLGQSVHDCFPTKLIQFVEEVKEKQGFKEKLHLNGVPGTLFGALMTDGNSQQGVILTFAPEDTFL